MNKILEPSLTLVLGGANSGKSAFAEKLVTDTGLPRIYCATAQAWDAEMQDKIARHQNDRGANWHTFECPLELARTLRSIPEGHAVLVDCLSMWLTNHLLAENDLAAQEAALCEALEARSGPVCVVSNEVGLGIVPDNALSRRFRTAQGRLNQTLAARADRVVAVMAGLPLALKGDLPT